MKKLIMNDTSVVNYLIAPGFVTGNRSRWEMVFSAMAEVRIVPAIKWMDIPSVWSTFLYCSDETA
jgi:preprotein translocase subunit Sec63